MNASATSTSVPQRPRRLWPWVVGGGFLCLLLAIGLIIVWGLTHQARSENKLAESLARIRAGGGPTNAAELELYYRAPPAEKDATRLWMAATAVIEQPGFQQDAKGLPIVGESEAQVAPPGELWDGLAAAEAFLQKHAATVAKLHEAADLGGAARYPTKFSNGINMLLPHVQALRGGARLLALEAHVHAHNNNPHGVARSLQGILRLANSLEHEPVLISQLVRIACTGVATQELKQLLPHLKFSDEDLAQLQAELRAAHLEEGLPIALNGERVITLLAYEDPTGLGGGQGPLWKLGWGVLRPEAAGIHLEFLNAQVDAAQRPWPEALQLANQAEEAFRFEAANAGGLRKLKFTMAQMTAPATTKVFHAVGRGAGRRDAADAALAIERFRLRHSQLPVQLADLVPDFLPAVPTDPFDGKPLRFVVRETEYMLYNVGVDGIDNLGLGDDSAKPDDPYIIPLLPRRP